MLISSVTMLAIVSMNYAFAELISNLQIISPSDGHYIYLKDKPLSKKSVMLRFQFLIKMKIAFVILYSIVAINLLTLKTSAYSIQQLNTSYQQKGLTFLFE